MLQQTRSYSRRQKNREVAQVAAQDERRKARRTDVAEMDTVLDDIESVLEENAVEMARTYKQAGGQ